MSLIQSIYLCIYLSIYLSNNTYLSTYLTIPIYLSIYLSNLFFSLSLFIKGDVRMLLSMACNCLDFTVDKYKTLLARSLDKKFIQPMNPGRNPLDKLDGECYIYIVTFLSTNQIKLYIS